MLLDKRGLKVSNIDYYEINEAFAAVNLHAEAKLGIPRDVTNLYGSSLSIGHPPGATGARMTMRGDEPSGQHRPALCHRLDVHSAGQGMAVLYENVAR